MVGMPSRVDLILSLVRALWGHITPKVRGVSTELDADLRVVRVRFVLDRDPDEDTRDAASCATTEVIAEFPSECGNSTSSTPSSRPPNRWSTCGSWSTFGGKGMSRLTRLDYRRRGRQRFGSIREGN
jgi:hypothetical protein